MFQENRKRSLVKTLAWKIIATLTTLFTVYWFTGTFVRSLKITIVAAIFGLIFFYIHERIWNKIKWGRDSD